MANTQTNRARILFLTQFSMLLAIEAIACFTPLGSITIGPLVATLGMIPVVITAIVLGTGAGTAMGFFAGLFSFLVWSFMPPNPIMPFVFTPLWAGGNFWSLVICFVPRILVGTVAGASFSLFSHLFRRLKNKKFAVSAYALSGILGSLVNTVLVLGGIWLFFGQALSNKVGQAILVLIGTTILTNGIPELVVSAIAASAIGYPLRRYLKKI